MLHMPVDVRNLSLALLTLFASVALLHWASAVFIPIMISLLLTTALRPAVEILWRWHVPRWLGAGVLLIAIVGGMATAAWSLSDGAVQLLDSLPVAAKKVRDNLKARSGSASPAMTPASRAASTAEAVACSGKVAWLVRSPANPRSSSRAASTALSTSGLGNSATGEVTICISRPPGVSARVYARRRPHASRPACQL